MFERFGEEARAVVVGAQFHARALDHSYIGCEHLLLAAASSDGAAASALRSAGLTPDGIRDTIRGIVGTPNDGLDRDALASVGIDLDEVRRRAEAAFGPRALAPHARRVRRLWRRRSCRDSSGHIPFTPRAKKCLELALREALALEHKHIGVEHIALALTRVDAPIVARILASAGTTRAQLRAEILRRHRLAG